MAVLSKELIEIINKNQKENHIVYLIKDMIDNLSIGDFDIVFNNIYNYKDFENVLKLKIKMIEILECKDYEKLINNVNTLLKEKSDGRLKIIELVNQLKEIK